MNRVEENIKLVWLFAQKYKTMTTCEIDDLFQIGCIGLIKADKTFKENLGIKFNTYAGKCISTEILKSTVYDKWNMTSVEEKRNSKYNIPMSIYDNNGFNMLENKEICQSEENNIINNIVINQYLHLLTRDQLENLVAHFFEGMGKTEIANIKGVTPSAIGRSIRDGLSKLRQQIKVY